VRKCIIKLIFISGFALLLKCSRDLPVDLNADQPEAPAYFEPTPYDRTVGIIINKNLYAAIKSSLDIYTADLSIIEGKKVWLCSETFDSTMPTSQLRDSLIRHYIHDGLEGAILIGDLPITWYEFHHDYEGYASFPTDLYFMDLDGKWFDTAKTGSWDGNAQSGVFDSLDANGAIEIWISRLIASTMNGNESDIVNAYFKRVHNRMRGRDNVQSRGLFFKCNLFSEGSYMDLLYPSERIVTYNHTPDNEKKDWLTEIRNGYEYVRIVEHGSPNCNSFSDIGFTYQEYDEMPQSPEGPSDIRFCNQYSCSNNRYTQPNIGTRYALGHNGLLSVGSTKIGGMIDCQFFHESLARKESFGDAFKEWFNKFVFGFDVPAIPGEISRKIRDSYGMTLVGAGTLRLAPYSEKVSHQIIVTKTQGGSINFEGRIMVPDGENRTFEIVPDQAYEIGSISVDDNLTKAKPFMLLSEYSNNGRTYPYDGILTMDSIHSDHSIDVEFVRRKEFTVSIVVSGCGLIGHYSNDSSVQQSDRIYYEGDDVSYRIIAKSYFCTLQSLNVNSMEIANVGEKLFFDSSFQIHGDHRITAMFQEKNQFVINLSSEGPGKITWLRSIDYLPERDSYGRGYESAQIKKDSIVAMLSSHGCFFLSDSTISSRENGNLVIKFLPDSICTVSQVIIDKDTLSNDSLYECFGGPCAYKYYYFPDIKSDHSVKAIFK
jgi:hypothetical protein